MRQCRMSNDECRMSNDGNLAAGLARRERGASPAAKWGIIRHPSFDTHSSFGIRHSSFPRGFNRIPGGVIVKFSLVTLISILLPSLAHAADGVAWADESWP